MTASTPTQNLILLASGGTGGHVFPAEALAVELKQRGYQLGLVTDRRGGEVRGQLAEIPVYRIRAGGIAGKGLLNRVRSTGELAAGTIQAWRLLKRLSPVCVVGFGGYASVPTMVAANLSGLTTAIHEQNAVLGRANRLLARRGNRIATCYDRVRSIPEGAEDLVVTTGMPVRQSIAALRDQPYVPPASGSPLRIFVMGGSQGASIFSDVVPRGIGMLPAEVRSRVVVVQQCRAADIDAARAVYADIGVEAELATFFDDAPRHIANAHLVISRSGASTIAELTAIGRPAILVPYAHAVDDHQTFNAHAVDEVAAGWLIPNHEFTAEILAERLEALFSLPQTLVNAAAAARAAGRPDAAERLAQVVIDLVRSSNGNGNGDNDNDDDATMRKEAA